MDGDDLTRDSVAWPSVEGRSPCHRARGGMISLSSTNRGDRGIDIAASTVQAPATPAPQVQHVYDPRLWASARAHRQGRPPAIHGMPQRDNRGEFRCAQRGASRLFQRIITNIQKDQDFVAQLHVCRRLTCRFLVASKLVPKGDRKAVRIAMCKGYIMAWCQQASSDAMHRHTDTHNTAQQRLAHEIEHTTHSEFLF